MHCFALVCLALTTAFATVDASLLSKWFCNPDKYYVEWVKQFEAQNAAGVAATYTPEVVIATNAYGILNGPAAVQGFFQAVFDQGMDKAKVITSVAESNKACTWGLSVGRFELWSSKNASVKSTGDFWKIMKKGNTPTGWIADIEHAFFAV
ncbi:hypothetical protein AAVH_22107 [Aphelenchoides avenae]|nr:hypothetical protein AAVH_22107 [Aphelenchus avenae]